MTDYPALPPAPDYGPPALPAAQHENPFEIFQRIHRLLRGRYVYAAVFGLLGAILGGIGGYFLTVPKYQSVGFIRIKTPTPKVYQLGEMGNQSSAQVRSVAQLLQVPRVLDKAMLSPEWKAVGRGLSEDAKDEFRDSLRV